MVPLPVQCGDEVVDEDREKGRANRSSLYDSFVDLGDLGPVEHLGLSIEPFDGVAERSVDTQVLQLLEDLDLGHVVEGRLEVDEQGPEVAVRLAVLFELRFGLPYRLHESQHVDFTADFRPEAGLGGVQLVYLLAVDEGGESLVQNHVHYLVDGGGDGDRSAVLEPVVFVLGFGEVDLPDEVLLGGQLEVVLQQVVEVLLEIDGESVFYLPMPVVLGVTLGLQELVKGRASKQHPFVRSFGEHDVLYVIPGDGFLLLPDVLYGAPYFLGAEVELDSVSPDQVLVVAELLPLIQQLELSDVFFRVGNVDRFYLVRVLLDSEEVFFADHRPVH